MTNGDAILAVLSRMGPMSRDDLAAQVQAIFDIPLVITSTCLYGMQAQGKIVMVGDYVSLPKLGDAS